MRPDRIVRFSLDRESNKGPACARFTCLALTRRRPCSGRTRRFCSYPRWMVRPQLDPARIPNRRLGRRFRLLVRPHHGHLLGLPLYPLFAPPIGRGGGDRRNRRVLDRRMDPRLLRRRSRVGREQGGRSRDDGREDRVEVGQRGQVGCERKGQQEHERDYERGHRLARRISAWFARGFEGRRLGRAGLGDDE